MISGDDAFLIFIAIFWGSMLGSAGRYQPFDTAAAFFSPWREPRGILARRRFIVSTFLLNALPILYLVIGYEGLKGCSGVLALVGAAIASLGIFGCPRVLHAVLATDKTHAYFFTENYWSATLTNDRHDREHRFVAHFAPGMVYLVGYLAIGILIADL